MYENTNIANDFKIKLYELPLNIIIKIFVKTLSVLYFKKF